MAYLHVLVKSPPAQKQGSNAFAKSTQGYSHVLTGYRHRMTSGIGIIREVSVCSSCGFRSTGCSFQLKSVLRLFHGTRMRVGVV